MKRSKSIQIKSQPERSHQKIKTYHLKLYLAGNSVNSQKAVQIIKEVCQKHLGSDYQLEIINVFENYQSALRDKILVAPTLVWVKKDNPAFLLGAFDRKRLLEFLELPEKAGEDR